MSFTRRNIAVRASTPQQQQRQSESAPPNAAASTTTNSATTTAAATAAPAASEGAAPSLSHHHHGPTTTTTTTTTTRLPGTRASPVDGRPTTSTGCLSLDGLLAGHAGLALGTSLLVGEVGTTDYASTLLRYFAAEGVVQGHCVHVVGAPPAWARELPAAVGLASAAASAGGGDGGGGGGTGSDRRTVAAAAAAKGAASERMKIAWRYERLGEFGAGNVRVPSSSTTTSDMNASSSRDGQSDEIFCHAFDLTKRLTYASSDPFTFHPIDRKAANPFASAKRSLSEALKKASSSSSGPDTVHRIVIPGLLSPAIYHPSQAGEATRLLPFLHFLRALLRTHGARCVLVLSLPLSLYPRDSGLGRWVELLSDGVLELAPFPLAFDNDVSGGSGISSRGGAATAREERPQGLLYVRRLPVFHERGGGGIGTAGVEDDLAFTVSRRRFVIKPFSLPPVEGDQEAQKVDEPDAAATAKKKLPKKENLEF